MSGTQDILIPQCNDVDSRKTFEDLLFSLMLKDSFRKKLRDWAYSRDDESPEFSAVNDYVRVGSRFDKNFRRFLKASDNRQTYYAKSFEWYISELLKRKFAVRASGFGIRLLDGESEDEFDCIAVIDDGIIFVECKTGKGSLFEEVEKFLHRDAALAATYSFFIFDRDFTFVRDKHKVDLPSLTFSQAKKIELQELQLISCPGGNFYSVRGADRWFLATSGFDHLETRLRHMFGYVYQSRQMQRPPHETYPGTVITFQSDPPAEEPPASA